MAEPSAKRQRVDNGGDGSGEVPPLLSAYGVFSFAVNDALRAGDEDVLQRITDKYTVDAQDGVGRTLLMWAAYLGSALSVRFLIERGAAVNLQDRLFTVLHYACLFELRHDVLVLLLEAGADPALKDGTGRTPRQYLQEGTIDE